MILGVEDVCGFDVEVAKAKEVMHVNKWLDDLSGDINEGLPVPKQIP